MYRANISKYINRNELYRLAKEKSEYINNIIKTFNYTAFEYIKSSKNNPDISKIYMYSNYITLPKCYSSVETNNIMKSLILFILSLIQRNHYIECTDYSLRSFRTNPDIKKYNLSIFYKLATAHNRVYTDHLPSKNVMVCEYIQHMVNKQPLKYNSYFISNDLPKYNYLEMDVTSNLMIVNEYSESSYSTRNTLRCNVNLRF